jgi:hypothetical protein
MGELGSVGKRWTVHVVQRALRPPVSRSSGGRALSEDGRRRSFELPTHPCLRFSSTLVVLWILLVSLVTVGCVFLIQLYAYGDADEGVDVLFKVKVNAI